MIIAVGAIGVLGARIRDLEESFGKRP